MDFALSGTTLYALGDCAKGTGLRAVSIETGASRRLGPQSLCGERITATRRALVVATTNRFDASVVTVFNILTGRVVRRLGLSSDPLDGQAPRAASPHCYRGREPAHWFVCRTFRADPRAKIRQRSPRLTKRLIDVVMPLPSSRLIVPV
jgi:hypothetical protein